MISGAAIFTACRQIDFPFRIATTGRVFFRGLAMAVEAGELKVALPSCGDETVYFLVICRAGWMNRNRQDVIEYLWEEIRAFKELLFGKFRSA